MLISRLTCDLHYWFLRVTWEEELEFALQVNWISAGDRLLDARILYALIFGESSLRTSALMVVLLVMIFRLNLPLI